MSKISLIIFLSFFFIEAIYCDACSSKFAYNYDDPEEDGEKDSVTINKFTDGYTRTVWNHVDSCNTYLNSDGRYCCYIHIEYKSNLDGERYDKYGCIDVITPFEDYGGNITMVENRVEEVKEGLSSLRTDDGKLYKVDNTTNFHVKIICGANFIKSSLFVLLVLILF